ncbi:MAG: DNA-binding protein [Nanoarchaeota archaeon]|nr:DNA-binding protein [Nanoarchaeota archaeon]
MNELEDLQKAKATQYQEQIKFQQQLAELEMLARNNLDVVAFERYNNMKIAHQELAVQALVMIAQLVQKGQIKQKITDNQFREILMRLSPAKRDFKITRK